MNWKLAGVVMLSAMLAGCELPEEKPKKPPEPRAATPEGRARQDIQAALGDDDGTTTASYDPDTRVYSVRWMIGSNLTDNMTRRGAQMDVYKILKALAASDLSSASETWRRVEVAGSYPLVDKYGNETVSEVVRMWFERSDVDRVNWENFLWDDTYGIAMDGSSWFHPAFQDGDAMGKVILEPKKTVPENVRPRLTGPVTLTISIVRLPGHRLRVRGSTNLPPDTALLITVTKKAESSGPQSKCSVSADGQFESETLMPQKGFRPGTYLAEVVMPIPAVQPRQVQEVIGRNGEHLSGPLVEKGTLGVTVRATKEFTVGGDIEAAQKRLDDLAALLAKHKADNKRVGDYADAKAKIAMYNGLRESSAAIDKKLREQEERLIRAGEVSDAEVKAYKAKLADLQRRVREAKVLLVKAQRGP